MLPRSMFSLLGRVPSDGSRKKQDLSTAHGCEARPFGIPLIPTDEHPDIRKASFPSPKAQVTRGEIKFFIIQWVIRNMHLAVYAEQFSIRINNCSRIVVEPGGPLFEQGSNDHNLPVCREFLKTGGRRSRNRLGKVEELMILPLAKILGPKKFLCADDLSATVCCPVCSLDGLLQIRFRVSRAACLQESNPH